MRARSTSTVDSTPLSAVVLMYMADPVDALRRLVSWVRPGGVVTFQEFDFNPAISSLSLPDETLWNQSGRLVTETFARAGTQMRMGRRLFGAFSARGYLRRR